MVPGRNARRSAKSQSTPSWEMLYVLQSRKNSARNALRFERQFHSVDRIRAAKPGDPPTSRCNASIFSDAPVRHLFARSAHAVPQASCSIWCSNTSMTAVFRIAAKGPNKGRPTIHKRNDGIRRRIWRVKLPGFLSTGVTARPEKSEILLAGRYACDGGIDTDSDKRRRREIRAPRPQRLRSTDPAGVEHAHRARRCRSGKS